MMSNDATLTWPEPALSEAEGATLSRKRERAVTTGLPLPLGEGAAKRRVRA
jgi:hypothetical protein